MIFGKPGTDPAKPGQPAEQFFVILTVAITSFAFALIFCQQR
jgi:hypothetical protein